jgi:hypothetical protein
LSGMFYLYDLGDKYVSLLWYQVKIKTTYV